MTKEELIKKLREIENDEYRDIEVQHSKADKLLLEYINDKEVSEAFDSIEKWYA